MFFYECNSNIRYTKDHLINLSYGQDFTNIPPTTLMTDRSTKNNKLTCNGFQYTTASGSDNLGAIKTDGGDGFTFLNFDLLQSHAMTFEIVLSQLTNTSTVFLEQSVNYFNNLNACEVEYVGSKFYLHYGFNGGTPIENTSNLSYNFTSTTKHTLSFIWNTDAVPVLDYCKFYLDGVKQTLTNTSNNATRHGVISTTTLYILSRNLTQYFLEGRIYNFRIYNKELNQSEINQNYKIDKKNYLF
jgi:hypothetical protein